MVLCTVLQFPYRRANQKNFSVLQFASYREHMHRLNALEYNCCIDDAIHIKGEIWPIFYYNF